MSAVKEKGGLTAKQEAFAQAYVELGNATDAYRRVYAREGTKALSVARAAHKMVHHPPIVERIADLRRAALARHDITVDRILCELAAIAFANMLDYVTIQQDGTARVDLNKISREQGAVINELAFTDEKFKFKLSDKLGALEKLGKHFGMFPTRVAGEDGGPVQIQLIKGDEQL